MSDTSVPNIVILGGGSAGWMTACLMHHAWAERGASITLVESPDIGIIGVGEGSTPQLKAFFDHLGIEEAEWMDACDATYKLGIRFSGWSERPGFESYFHPFPGPTDLHTQPGYLHNCALARRGVDVPVLPDDWFLAARIASEGKSPIASANFPFAPSYGYHFDAYKLGAFLRDWSTARGVIHREARIDDVSLGIEGSVEALVCEDGETIPGDFFIDCSGFRAMIAGQVLGARHIAFSDSLFNDRAVVMPTQHSGPYKPQTESIAMQAGWRWKIPLTTRIGNGYVYSSKHISDEDAESELRAALGVGAEGEARHLRMRVGRLENSWTKNCLSTGLAQGFVEPLEATALHIVIATALEFIEAFEKGGFTSQHRETFNGSIGARYDGIRDYIVAHYRMNQRGVSDYWRENASNEALSPEVKSMITAWFTHRDIAEAAAEAYTVPTYSTMSWHALFAGYGTLPPQERMQPIPTGVQAADLKGVAEMLDACMNNFPPLQG